MEFIVLFVMCILALDSICIIKNRNQAELYCRYRIWKDRDNDRRVAIFERELFLILNGGRKYTIERYRRLALGWMGLPDKEKDAFFESCRPVE